MEIMILNDRGIPTGIEFYSRYLRSDLLHRNQYIAAVCERVAANKASSAFVHQQCEEMHHLTKFFTQEEWPALYAQQLRLQDILGQLVIAELTKSKAS